MRSRLFPAFLLLLAPLLAAGQAAAQPAQPLDRLLPQIRRDHPGQFLDAEGANTGGNPHYHLKWLTPDGRVMWLDTDARTGRVVNQAPGRDRFDAQRDRGGDDGGPPDRRDEGRGYQRYDRQYNSRFDNFRQYDNRGADAPRPERGPADGNERPGNFGGRFERGGERGNFNGGNERNFGGGFGGRPDFGNRGFGGGGRGRRGR